MKGTPCSGGNYASLKTSSKTHMSIEVQGLGPWRGLGQRPNLACCIGQCVPIRLSPTPTICRVLSRSRIKLGVGRCGDVAGDAEKGTGGIERIESSVEAEGELVEVGLEMLVADAVMDAGQPGFQVGKDEMDDRQIRLGHPGIAPFGD